MLLPSTHGPRRSAGRRGSSVPTLSALSESVGALTQPGAARVSGSGPLGVVHCACTLLLAHHTASFPPLPRSATRHLPLRSRTHRPMRPSQLLPLLRHQPLLPLQLPIAQRRVAVLPLR